MGTPSNRPTRIEMIATRMMRGCNGKTLRNQSKDKIKEFSEQHKVLLDYLGNNLPKNVSVGVCAAIGKAILWYGNDTMKPFCDAFINKEYQGLDDPIHTLWHLIMFMETDAEDIYRRTVTAIRHHLRNAKTTRLKPALEDIFEWNEDYTQMTQPKKNQYTNCSIRSEVRQTNNCQVEQEVQ